MPSKLLKTLAAVAFAATILLPQAALAASTGNDTQGAKPAAASPGHGHHVGHTATHKAVRHHNTHSASHKGNRHHNAHSAHHHSHRHPGRNEKV